MTDLTHVSTVDLVRELEGRGGVEYSTLQYEVEWNLEVYDGDNDGGMSGYGPATILVVRGERE